MKTKFLQDKRTRWITASAIFIALLIGVQFATAPLGQLVTGSLVNLILIVSVMTYGTSTGLTVALISPIMASLIGIGPLWAIVPIIMAGNSTLVLIWRHVGKLKFSNTTFVRITTLAAAALGKFLVLYVGVVLIAVPLMQLPEQQAERLSAIFSVTQLITASIGGVAAIIILPILNKARTARTL